MKCADQFLRWPLVALIGTVLLITACAPATTGLAPSGALSEQLTDIKQQQQQQALLMQQLQQQLSQLKQQLGVEDIVTTQIQKNLEPLAQGVEPTAGDILTPALPIQFNAAPEVSALAASASSYLAAFSNLAAGRWLSAESGFEDFLSEFFDHQYAPNARYWLANAQISQGKTELALSNLRQIVGDPKGQSKAPAALLQIAQLYRQQGLSTQADLFLEELRNRYPDSPEAQYLDRSKEPNN
jgi:tol-pal system protein YbgF